MERTQILDAVYDACVEVLKVDRAGLTETTSFAEDLEADSLALVEVVMQLEEEFDLRIPEDELEGATTIGAAADIVAAHVEAAA
ncbi:MAG TPA: acyl carrier protein [Aquihabitans sp.]|jgi:acyl carrier protein|nr:acyl carrier protein [Aquihabitans sp.]